VQFDAHLATLIVQRLQDDPLRSERWVSVERRRRQVRLQVKSRGLELSPELRSYAESKLGRLDRQLADETAVEVELVEETKGGRFTAEANVFAKGQTLRATESTSDLRASIDKLVDNLERQIVAYREKRRLERRRRTEHHGV
jgi:putative sigma-54 modulation protein